VAKKTKKTNSRSSSSASKTRAVRSSVKPKRKKPIVRGVTRKRGLAAKPKRPRPKPTTRTKAPPKTNSGPARTEREKEPVEAMATAVSPTFEEDQGQTVEYAYSPVGLDDGKIRLAPEGAPLPRTRLSDKQLSEFRELLLRKRRELVGDLQRLTDEALNRSREGYGEHSTMPIHMADVGTDNWEQELTLGLAESERTRVREIDEALQRVENKTYGICLATHRPITVARLRAKPWARYCIEYERLRDEGRVP